jgi:hypothetical protein
MYVVRSTVAYFVLVICFCNYCISRYSPNVVYYTLTYSTTCLLESVECIWLSIFKSLLMSFYIKVLSCFNLNYSCNLFIISSVTFTLL